MMGRQLAPSPPAKGSVILTGSTPGRQEALSRAPQGSVLGLVMFNVCIKDLNTLESWTGADRM